MNVLERPTFGFVVGFMTLERRQVTYDENHFELDMRKKKKHSREEPEFQVFVVCPNIAFIISEVYPERDEEIAAAAEILVGLKQRVVKRERDT